MQLEFSLEEVEKYANLTSHTLRNWEKRYEFIQPKRKANGYRYYTIDDLVKLDHATQLMEQGHKISEISKDYEKLVHSIAYSDTTPDEIRHQRQKLFDALSQFMPEDAHKILDRLSISLSPEQLLDYVYQPLLAKTGMEWSQNHISIAQEHYISAFIRLRLGQYLCFSRGRGETSSKIVLASVGSEMHEGGLLLLAANLALSGLDVLYLGANTPSSELQNTMLLSRANTLCLSYVITEPDIPTLADLKKALPFVVSIIIGGPGVDTQKKTEALRSGIISINQSGKQAAKLIELLVNRD